MNLSNKSLNFTFFSSFGFFLSFPLFFPELKLFYFVPFLIILTYQKSLIHCLWGALGCGMIIDLFSAEPFFALHALNYSFIIFVIHQLRFYFFADSLTTLPLLTFLFSILSTVLHLLLYYIFGIPFSLNLAWLKTDLVYMPLLDALYGFAFFILPSFIFGKRVRSAREYFLERGVR